MRERPERTQEGGQLPFEVTSLQIRSQMNPKLHQRRFLLEEDCTLVVFVIVI